MVKQQKRGPGERSYQNIQERQRIVSKICEELARHGQHPKPEAVHKIMRDKYRRVDSLGVVRSDIKVINQQDTFIRDLSESSYSTHIRNIFDALQSVENEARRRRKMVYTANKTVTRVTDKGTSVETTTTEPLVTPSIGFLKIELEAIEHRLKLLTGPALNISVALFHRKAQELEMDKRRLEQQVRDLKAGTPELKEREPNTVPENVEEV